MTLKQFHSELKIFLKNKLISLFLLFRIRHVLAIMYFTVVLKIKYTHLFFAKKLIKVEILRKFLHSIFLVNKWQYTYLLYAKKTTFQRNVLGNYVSFYCNTTVFRNHFLVYKSYAQHIERYLQINEINIPHIYQGQIFTQIYDSELKMEK